MPVFHTKTIESILDPVAQQVSRLVIIHEEGEAGHEMPDIRMPVHAVSKAVGNLVKVGREMVQATDDDVMRHDMPHALARIENAADLLEGASQLSQRDPYSQPARRKLIEGSRWILQGTSNVLMVFDESEVRKIIGNCKKVLDYLAVAEVIESVEDLVQFVQDLSPCLSKVTKEVDKRIEDLTHQLHREILTRSLDQIKTLSPILVCAMKIYIEITTQAGAKGGAEASENRNYLVNRMAGEVGEIVRVLQLTSYDEDEWNSDNLAVMHKTESAMEGRVQAARDWLQDPTALPKGSSGEKALRQLLEQAGKIAERSAAADAAQLRKLGGDVGSMAETLCELRAKGEGASPQAESLARSTDDRLVDLLAAARGAIDGAERSGATQKPSPTVAGRLEQARRWLEQPNADDRGLGLNAIALLAEDGLKVAAVLPGAHGEQLRAMCGSVERSTAELSRLVADGQGGSPGVLGLARHVASTLGYLRDAIQNSLVDKVVEDFLDVATPLKQLADVVVVLSPCDEAAFAEKAARLSEFSGACARTARMVAVGADAGRNNKKVGEALFATSAQLESLAPQLVNAGRIRMAYRDNKAAGDHFENLRGQYAGTAQRLRALCDVATDSAAFIARSATAMYEATDGCEAAIQTSNAIGMVESTSRLARLANRVLHMVKQEAENSEDPTFIDRLNEAGDKMHLTVAPMVTSAKSLAKNVTHPGLVHDWRSENQKLLESVQGVEQAVASERQEEPPLPPYPNISDLSISDDSAPPRPPLPAEMANDNRSGRANAFDTTDDESEEIFQKAPTPSQGPIMMAAHDLHQEVKQWSSKDNDVIVAAKKMALLMAKLSQLVREDSGGSKRELIACAKSIADSSEEVTRIAKALARECTDKRMRTSLLQVCERIPTIATQLKILSTVKATMLGAQGTEEDQEATEMLVGNAQNLMQSVKQTVTAAEAATIKIRTDAGIRLIWSRKQPWYSQGTDSMSPLPFNPRPR